MSGSRDPVEEWRDVSARAARVTGYRPDKGSRVAGRLPGLSIGIIAAALVIVVAGLALRPLATATSSNPPSPSSSSGAPSSTASSGPVVGTVDDGMFRLTLATPRGTYEPAEVIEPIATLTYLGPEASVKVFHAAQSIGFRIEEVGGPRIMGGGMDEPCLSTLLAAHVPSAVPFAKAGVPDAEFDRAWYEDPVLRLPEGTWRIIAAMDIYVGGGDLGCRGVRHQLTTENLVRVVPVNSPAGSPTPPPTASPTLSADARTALATVQAYETTLAGEKSDVAGRLLSPWSRTAIGSFGTFAAVERHAAANAARVVIEPPSQDPELLGEAFLGPRAVDLAANADPSRTFLVSVRDPDVDGAAAATLNLVAAPLEDGSWRIWLDVSPGRFGAAAYPTGCAAFGLSKRRCDFIVSDARSGQGIDPAGVTTTWLLPDPGCGGDPTSDQLTMCMRTQAFVVGVEFELADRATERRDYFCGVGGQTTLICSDAPQIDASDFHAAGYWDTPCAGEAPDGCASPVPVPTGAAAEGARALDLASIDVPVGAVGHHEVEVGTAVLAGGVVQEARFSLGDQRQDGFLLDPGRVQLVLRSTIAGRPPFENIHSRGVFDRPETVRVLVVFDVAEVSGKHWIHVTDLEVR